MRLVNKGPVLCELQQCMCRGDWITCYHDSGKASYRRCELYQLRLKVNDIRNLGNNYSPPKRGGVEDKT